MPGNSYSKVLFLLKESTFSNIWLANPQFFFFKVDNVLTLCIERMYTTADEWNNRDFSDYIQIVGLQETTEKCAIRCEPMIRVV